MINSILKSNVEKLLKLYSPFWYFGIKCQIKIFRFEHFRVESAVKEVVSVSDVNFEQLFEENLSSQQYSVPAIPLSARSKPHIGQLLHQCILRPGNCLYNNVVQLYLCWHILVQN